MCTVTIINQIGPAPGDAPSVRLLCNRDEQRTRQTARPPQIFAAAGRQVAMPVDPASGGTWIAASDAGLIFTLLNVNLQQQSQGTANSRGGIIPALVDCSSLQQAAERAMSLDPAGYKPFRLVVVSSRELCDIWSDGRRLVRHDAPLRRCTMYTSSGLGDHLVDRPRRDLLLSMVANMGVTSVMQQTYHEHHWPDRPYLSVRMSRADACTVSRTDVTMVGKRVAMSYRAIWPHVQVDVPVLIEPNEAFAGGAMERFCNG